MYKRQGLYVTALAFDMLPEAERPATVQTLAGLIAQNGDRLDTGFLSVSHLLDALYNHGQQALAFRLLFQTQCPGWLYEVSQGATTLWETWNAVLPDGTVQASSMNHFAFGCVGDWMMRRLACLLYTSPPGWACTGAARWPPAPLRGFLGKHTPNCW